MATAPFTIVATAPPAGPIAPTAVGPPCVRRVRSAVRTACRGPRLAYVPYPCENDWYCGTDWDLDMDWDPGSGTGFPVVPVASDHVDE